MTINFDTAVKGLEQWTAPKEIEKSGFGKLKVEGQEVTVCAKAVGDIHKIGQQLRRLGNMNTSKSKQDWEDNKAVVRELDGQIKALGATLDDMKGASSNLKTSDDIKAAIQFTTHIAAKANLIEEAITGIKDKLDQETLADIQEISKRLAGLTNKNSEIRAQLNDMKVSKHVEPEAKSKVDFLRVYAGVSKLPGIGKLIKGFAGLFVNLDAKVQVRLNSQLDSLAKSLGTLGAVSDNTTSSTEVGELLKRTGEAKERLADFTGIALTVFQSTTDNELGTSSYKTLTAARNMSDKLSQFEIELTQKKELLTQQEALAPLEAAFDRTHDFDISSAGALLRKLEEFEDNLLIATMFGIPYGNEEIVKNLGTQIETLSARAHKRLEKFGVFSLKEESAGYEVTVAHLEKEYKKINKKALSLPEQMETDPGLAQKNILNLLEKTTQLEGLQKQISGHKPQLIEHQGHIGELRTELKEKQIQADAVIALEATYIQGQTESLTVVFQELHRLAADHRTPESERLEEIKAQKSAAERIIFVLKDDPVTAQSPNYPKYSAELFRAKEARTMARTLISMFDEKIKLEGIRKDLSTLDSENLSRAEIETKINDLQAQVQDIQTELKYVKLKKGSPNKALFDELQASMKPLQAEINKIYWENKVNIITSKLHKLSQTIETNFHAADLHQINAWQQSLTQHARGLNSLNGEETTEYLSIQSAQLNEISELKTDLKDRAIILEANDNREIVEKHLKQMRDSIISIDHKVIALNDIIVLILPTQIDLLKKVASANKEGSKNFNDYSTAMENIDILAKAAINDRDAYLNSSEAVASSLNFGAEAAKGISKQLDAVLNEKSILSDDKEKLIDSHREDVSNLVKYYESQKGKFPLSTEAKALVDQGREECESLLQKVNEAGAAVAENAELIRGAREWEAVIDGLQRFPPDNPDIAKQDLSRAIEDLRGKLEQSTDENDQKYIGEIIKKAQIIEQAKLAEAMVEDWFKESDLPKDE